MAGCFAKHADYRNFSEPTLCLTSLFLLVVNGILSWVSLHLFLKETGLIKQIVECFLGLLETHI